MAVSNQQKNQHLLWRAGFGPAAEEMEQLKTATPKAYLKALMAASAKAPAPIDVVDNNTRELFRMISDAQLKRKELSDMQRRELQKNYRDGIKRLNLAWMNQMVNSDAQLREKMALFWHGHFASRQVNLFFNQALLNEIRTRALGNFGDLLKAVSHSASMLAFLNNQQNRKQSPNENFAREVMELFTMGRGNYTEKDIKEAARAFTGWGYNAQGDFVFRKNVHDEGVKTVLGKTGNLTGDDVLNILLEQKQTATYITTKIYRYFVNEEVNQQHVNWLAERFYKNGYRIDQLMNDIFSSDWFYEEKNIGVKIKSPVELLAGIRRLVPMNIENEEVQLLFQRALGQLLFYPPNVAGWPGGKNWIDSSTLMLRMRIPQLISESAVFSLSPKDDDDIMMGIKDKPTAALLKAKGGGQQIKVVINWNVYTKQFEQVPREQLLNKLSDALLQLKPASSTPVAKYTDSANREQFIKTATIQLMSTPEYQLC